MSTEGAIVWLDDDACTVDVVGPKAAALGTMRRAGLSVPRGFVVTPQPVEVVRLYDAAQSGGDWRRHALTLRATLGTAPLPANLAEGMRRSIQQVRAPLAVRSSALVEDEVGASFAGLFTTFLGILNLEDAMTAVRSIWASRFRDTAIRYATGRGVDLRRTQMAVIVQEAIDARSAGSALSIDPAGAIVINGAWGLGRAVAEGQVVPDSWRVDRQDLTLLESRSGIKPIAARLDPRGGEVWRRQTQQRRTAACLDDRTLRRLAALVVETERLFGGPREVEWALDRRRRLWLLQARPFTAARSFEPAADADHLHPWIRDGSVLEGQPTSPGQVVGRARHLSNATHVSPGDVLIAASLPPGMTALVAGVGGLVVEAGGSTGHAATLARERGTPAVFGAVGAHAIPADALVLVDGTSGHVWYRVSG